MFQGLRDCLGEPRDHSGVVTGDVYLFMRFFSQIKQLRPSLGAWMGCPVSIDPTVAGQDPFSFPLMHQRYRSDASGLSRSAISRAGADVILLPEYWSTAFFPATRDYKCYSLASPDHGPAITAMKLKAKEHNLHIIAALFEQDGSDLFYDTAMLIDPDGNIMGKYRKTPLGGERHLVIDGELNTDLGIESIYFRTGSRYPVFRIGQWNVGIILCYDTYFPEAARCLALAGAEVIMAPFGISDTKDTIWKELLATRAFENMVYFLAANNIGTVPAPDIPVYALGGKSIAFDPTGKLIAEASYDQEGILIIELDRDHLEYARKLHMMYRDRRPGTYGIISTHTDDIERT